MSVPRDIALAELRELIAGIECGHLDVIYSERRRRSPDSWRLIIDAAEVVEPADPGVAL